MIKIENKVCNEVRKKSLMGIQNTVFKIHPKVLKKKCMHELQSGLLEYSQHLLIF